MIQTSSNEIFLAQPANSAGSTRWEYVIRRGNSGLGARQQVNAFLSATAAVSHPNLITVLDGSTDASIPYLVMPRIVGSDLQTTRTRQGTLPLPWTLWMVRQAASGLAALHAAGWVHGDVKPKHLMIDNHGQVTVIDLGLATPIHTTRRHALRPAPQYAAPETMNGNFAALPSSDIFSLGRLLWENLTLLPPTPSRWIEPVADLVERMVHENPSHRPTALEIANELLRIELRVLSQHIGPNQMRQAA
jgi:eukaryotic-like serine/threonine-protein kinase